MLNYWYKLLKKWNADISWFYSLLRASLKPGYP